MEDKYFRIDSGTRLMSVMYVPSIGFPVGGYGYTSTGDMLESINRMIGELMDDSELSMFHNVDGERMFDMVCHNIGVPCGEDYRLLFPLNDIKGPVGYETVEVSIGKRMKYDDIEIDCDRRLYVLSNLDSRKGLIEFLECLKGLVLYGEFKRCCSSFKRWLSMDKVVEWCCMFLLSCSLFYLLFFLLLVLFYHLGI